MKRMLDKAADMIMAAERITAFTGSGISVESGIPSFRGENGLWNTYNPMFLEIGYFHSSPKQSWKLIKEIFYEYFGDAKPNPAHKALAEMENKGYLTTVITQNIDNLHTDAGNTNVLEFHGNSRNLRCLKCGQEFPVRGIDISELPPLCSCGGLLKPDFVFFGEMIPEPAQSLSFEEADKSDLVLVVGTTGEVMPASFIPYKAKDNGAQIIEVNPEKSKYTDSITDVFLQGKAGEALPQLVRRLAGR